MNQTCNPTTPAMSGEFDNPGLLQRLREEPAPPWTARDGIFLSAAVIVGLILVEWGLWGGLNLGFSIGYALLLIRDCGHAGLVKRRVIQIEEFCVQESLRGQGIGMEMMAEVRALAKAFRCTDLQLGVYPQNDGAVAFYQKCGFTIRSIDMQRKV